MAMLKVKESPENNIRREKFEKVKCDNCGRVFAVAASQVDKVDCPKCAAGKPAPKATAPSASEGKSK